MADDELRELIKDAPRFEHMERGELVAHAYGLFAAGNKAGAENAKLRELVKAFDWCTEHFDLPNKCDKCPLEQSDKLTPECEVRMRKLGIEVE